MPSHHLIDPDTYVKKKEMFVELLDMKYWKVVPTKEPVDLYVYEGDLDGTNNANGIMAVSHFDASIEQMKKYLQIPGEFEKTSPVLESMNVSYK